MAKKGALSVAERYYIENNFSEKETSEIAINLDRTVSQVQEYINSYLASRGKASSQFARQKNVTIMTQNASMLGDEERTKTVKPNTSSYITKAKKDDSL
jgi:hypothetical protein